MQQVGFGTQRIEEEARLLFPQAKIQRMDVDTTRSRDAIENMIDDFASGKIDILIGTQMVSKGLDFEKVSLVGVMDADHMIHFPDFRAHERAFQMLTQVSGRSGRKKEQGRVLMQTRDYGQEVLQFVQKHNYEGFYKQEIEERKQYFYPPFARIILLRVKSMDKALCQKAAERLHAALQLQIPDDVTLTLPHEPLINKVRNRYIREVVLFFPRDYPAKRLKHRIANAVDQVKGEKEFGKIRIILDVDPV
jgi:primosomal protein N' (replication factor Y)